MDFSYTRNGELVVEDVKSRATRTRDYIMKKKMMRRDFGFRRKGRKKGREEGGKERREARSKNCNNFLKYIQKGRRFMYNRVASNRQATRIQERRRHE